MLTIAASLALTMRFGDGVGPVGEITFSAEPADVRIVSLSDDWQSTGLLIASYEETRTGLTWREEWWLGGSLAIAPTLMPDEDGLNLRPASGMLAVRVAPLPLLIADRRGEAPDAQLAQTTEPVPETLLAER